MIYGRELSRIKKRIDGLHNKGVLNGKEIYFFGASDNTKQLISIIKKKGYETKGIIDNDHMKQGGFMCGRLINSVESIEIKKNSLVFIYSFFDMEMIGQLLSIGWEIRQIICLSDKEYSTFYYLNEARLGRKIYKKIEFPESTEMMFICPYTGTGDIYLIGCFWKEYIRRINIQSYRFVVVSKACAKVAKLFDIENIHVISSVECEQLIRYYMMFPEKLNIKILNDGWAQINANQTEWFRGYKGLYFMNLFRKFVFSLPDDIVPVHPELKNVSTSINSIFDEKKLKQNKTIVISPYSNTLADLPWLFWERLAKKLQELDYKVCTNSSGDEEPPIKNTQGVFFSLDVAPQFIEKAGYFIGVRSGFCDVISGAKAKKVVLYDKHNKFYMCSAFDYFNLKEMELSNDTFEIEFDHDCLDETINTICNIISS